MVQTAPPRPFIFERENILIVRIRIGVTLRSAASDEVRRKFLLGTVLEFLLEVFLRFLEFLLEVFGGFLEFLLEVFGGFLEYFRSILEFLLDVFKGFLMGFECFVVLFFFGGFCWVFVGEEGKRSFCIFF